MNLLNAIEIDDSDFVAATEGMHWQSALSKDAKDASLTAELVVYRGEIIKNRLGPITGTWERLRKQGTRGPV